MTTMEIIAAIAAAIAAYFGWRAKQVGETVNDAVNHRHQRRKDNGDPPPKLYDLAIENHSKINHLLTMQDEQNEKIGLIESRLNQTCLDTAQALDALSTRVKETPCRLLHPDGPPPDCPDGHEGELADGV